MKSINSTILGKFKTSLFVAAIGYFVSLFVLASATAEDKTVWAKYNNAVPGATNTTSTDGRIPLGTDTKGDDTYAESQAVIKEGSTNRMWYGGHDGTSWRIYYATSLDGLVWAKYDNNIPGASDSICTNGTIALGTSGGDAKGAYDPCVIKDGYFYKMWYDGYDGTNWRIYHATSSNGLTWTKYTNAVPPASNTTGTYGRIPLGISGGDSKYVQRGLVIKDGLTYKMWYTGSDGTNWRIYHATSPDGLTWAKYDNSVPDDSNTTGTNGRIPLGTSGGDASHVFSPGVIKVGSTYKMWYSAIDGSKWRIYYATSTDGLTWKKYTNAIPDNSDTTSTDGRVPLGQSGGDTNGVLGSCVIKDGYFYKMWYTGRGANNTARIYHATLDAVPEGTIFYSY